MPVSYSMKISIQGSKSLYYAYTQLLMCCGWEIKEFHLSALQIPICWTFEEWLDRFEWIPF